MKRSILLAATLTGSLLLTHVINAQTVATDPVGFVQPFSTGSSNPNMLANSDTNVSVPFTRPPEFVGATSAATTNTLTVSGSPWTAHQFQYNAGANQHNTYYALVGPHSTTNPKEGRMYQVSDNTANQLTLTTGGDDISSVAANTQILVIPYHTLSTVFPATDAGVSFIASANQFTRQTQILIPAYNGVGTNLSAGATYFYMNGHWRLFGESGLPSRDDDALPNAGFFTVRNAGTATTLTTLGSVLTKKTTIPLFTRTGGQQDNFVSVVRPVDVKLSDLGLITSGAFQASPNQFTRVDNLLVFDHASPVQNRSASATYFYMNNAWRKFGEAGLPDRSNDIISAGDGFIIRKGATGNGLPVYWTNAPTY